MMCYRDKTFCQFWQECQKGEDCHRRLDDEVKSKAVKWWGNEDAPICTYVDKQECFERKE